MTACGRLGIFEQAAQLMHDREYTVLEMPNTAKVGQLVYAIIAQVNNQTKAHYFSTEEARAQFVHMRYENDGFRRVYEQLKIT